MATTAPVVGDHRAGCGRPPRPYASHGVRRYASHRLRRPARLGRAARPGQAARPGLPARFTPGLRGPAGSGLSAGLRLSA